MALSYSRKAKNILCIVLLSIGQAAMAQDNSLNIDTCYTLARRNYPIIKQLALIERSKEFTISNANKSYLPQISVTAISGVIGGLPSVGGESGGADLSANWCRGRLTRQYGTVVRRKFKNRSQTPTLKWKKRTSRLHCMAYVKE